MMMTMAGHDGKTRKMREGNGGERHWQLSVDHLADQSNARQFSVANKFGFQAESTQLKNAADKSIGIQLNCALGRK
ncbi:hypothetical protein A7M48_18830 [Acinetobacter baumannii]|nr:hypothetical protein A7M48_18830 [Acinetobacter baumannii]